MAMIPYPELVAALHNWRARKGLDSGPAQYLSSTPAAPAGIPSMPAPRPTSTPPAAPAPAYGAPEYGEPDAYGAAALGGVASAYGAEDDGEYDDGDLDIVAEEDDQVAVDDDQVDAAGIMDRAPTDSQTVDDEETAIAGSYDEVAYGGGDSGTVDVGEGEVMGEEIEHGEIDRTGPPPLAPPDDEDDNPWK